MLNTGRILEASDLGIEYINAVLGNGIENFGLETYLTSVTQMAVWLPLNTLEVLLYELKEISEKPIFSENYQRLQQALDKYKEKVINVSKDMIEIKLSKKNH